MKVLSWHVHGSWQTSFVQGPHDHLIPVVPGRGPEGQGRARTWDWPAAAREVTPEQLRDEDVDVVVLQRPMDAELLERWTGRRVGVDVPAVYVEHNTPAGPAAATRHPLADRSDIMIVHVTWFNAVMWDCGKAPTTVIEHGIVDPGHLWTGERERLGVVVNEPVRRWRVAGTDLMLRLAEQLPLEVYGMGMGALAEYADRPAHPLVLHDDLPQGQMHAQLAGARAYVHPYRWTSLGLSLLEAMALGLPVLALSTTEAPEAVPSEAGVLSNDLDVLAAAGRRWLQDPDEARERGEAARAHVLARFGVDRFVADWQTLLKEVAR